MQLCQWLAEFWEKQDVQSNLKRNSREKLAALITQISFAFEKD